MSYKSEDNFFSVSGAEKREGALIRRGALNRKNTVVQFNCSL